MNLLKSLICSQAVMIVCYVIDGLLILGALGLFLWYYLKNTKKTSETKTKDRNIGRNIEKLDDDTYVLNQEIQEVPEVEIKSDNAVEHFVNQISDINEETNNENSYAAIVVKHEVEPAVKKVPRKDEIQNYVMIGGVKKEKTEEEKVTSFNRGTNAFKNSTNFLNTIKSEQVEQEKVSAEKVAPVTINKPVVENKPVETKKSAEATTKKATTAKKTTTTTKKKTTAK